MIRKLSLIIFILLLSSCSLRQLPPEVRLVGLQLEDATLFETTLLVEIRIENDNPEEIQIAGGTHKLYINGEYVGKGFDKKGFLLPRLDSVVVPITVHVNNISLLTKLQKMTSETMLKYRVESNLFRTIPKSPFVGRNFKASTEGSVSLGKLAIKGHRAPLPSL